MEVQSKQGPMVGWAVRKDTGTSKAMFIQSTWERKLTKQELEEVILDTV